MDSYMIYGLIYDIRQVWKAGHNPLLAFLGSDDAARSEMTSKTGAKVIPNPEPSGTFQNIRRQSRTYGAKLCRYST